MSARTFISLLFLSAIALVIFYSCTGTSEYYRSYTDLYKTSAKEELKFDAAVVHEDDNYSWLEYEVQSKQLVYKYTDFDTVKTATVKISFHMQVRFGLKNSEDTANYIVRDHVKVLSDHMIRGRFKIKVPSGGKWFLELHAMDMNSGLRGSQTIFIRKENIFSAQNFSTEIPGKGLFVSPYLGLTVGLLIKPERKENTEELFVDFFRLSMPPAAPPFSLTADEPINYKPDSSFIITQNESGKFQLAVDRHGFFHCRADTAVKDGITYFYFYRDFPEVNNYGKMLESARYIMTSEEFNSAILSQGKKEVVDKFWLGLAGGADRARALISAWYGRVKDANIYFSSFKEGWKTDRGMIYVVFGSPKNIYKTSTRETWVYGDERSARSLTFVFNKVDNPFSENDFVMERNSSYKNAWFIAVDTWRQGRVYFSQ